MAIIKRIKINSKRHKIDTLITFFQDFKNQTIEAKEIVKFDKNFKVFVEEIKKSEYYKRFFENYLQIKGYTYRLEDNEQRLFYTFQEAVYAIDLARLTQDNDAKLLNAVVYALVISDAIDEVLEKPIDENLKEEAIAFYNKLEQQRAKENQKYHMYQN